MGAGSEISLKSEEILSRKLATVNRQKAPGARTSLLNILNGPLVPTSFALTIGPSAVQIRLRLSLPKLTSSIVNT